MGQLRVTEIFLSLQGETSFVGLPTAFVRLTGCPLRCNYCDTAYAFSGGQLLSLSDILDRLAEYESISNVTVTGGEPLAQEECSAFLNMLCDHSYRVSLETSGALDVSGVDSRVSKIVDFKTPGSGEVGRNSWDNLVYCGPNDQIKFVICDRKDYEWVKLKCDQYQLFDFPGEVLFSASWGQLEYRSLAEWILEDRLPVRMQPQLHKIIWGEVPGR
tara:strand:+ start:2674 stop:3321 length:648 start_codon:yes stop_codon:yes gene_type:complete